MGELGTLLWMMADATGDAIAEAGAVGSESVAKHAVRTVKVFEERLEKLALLCMAMWSLMREKTGLTEKDLLERVKQIDLMDGREDGKLKKTVLECRSCGRAMSSRHTRCLYCGAPNLKRSAFEV